MRKFLALALAGLLAVMSAGPALADDAEGEATALVVAADDAGAAQAAADLAAADAAAADQAAADQAAADQAAADQAAADVAATELAAGVPFELPVGQTAVLPQSDEPAEGEVVLQARVQTATAGIQTAPATDNKNNEEYWEALYPGSTCYKHDPPSQRNAHGYLTAYGKSVVLYPFNPDWPGDRWEVLIVKGGSAGGDGSGNAVYNLPTAGTPYAAPANNGGQIPTVGHWIVCKGTSPSVAVVPAVFTSPTCDYAGSLTGVNTASYTWVRTGPNTAAVLTATPVGSAVLSGQTVFGPYDLTKRTGPYCEEEEPETVLPPAPSYVDVCGTEGDGWIVTEPAADAGYTVVVAGNTLTYHATAPVTFDAADVAVAFADVPGFVGATATTITFSYVFTDVPCEDTTATLPPVPTYTDVCGTVDDGWLYSAPAADAGYTVVEDGDVLRFVASSGFAFDVALATALYADLTYFTSATATTITFTYDFTDMPCYQTATLPPVPTYTDLCGTEADAWIYSTPAAGAGYTVVENGDVLEFVASSGFTFDATLAAGLYGDLSYFTSATATTITFTYDFTDEACAVAFVPVAPSVTHQVITCTSDYMLATTSGTITVTATPGVEYLLGGGVITGTVQVAPGAYTVTARSISQPELTQAFGVVVTAGTAPACIRPVLNVPIVPTVPAATTVSSVPTAFASVAAASTPVVRAATPQALAATGFAGLQLMGLVGLLALGAVLTASARSLRGPREIG